MPDLTRIMGDVLRVDDLNGKKGYSSLSFRVKTAGSSGLRQTTRDLMDDGDPGIEVRDRIPLGVEEIKARLETEITNSPEAKKVYQALKQTLKNKPDSREDLMEALSVLEEKIRQNSLSSDEAQVILELLTFDDYIGYRTYSLDRLSLETKNRLSPHSYKSEQVKTKDLEKMVAELKNQLQAQGLLEDYQGKLERLNDPDSMMDLNSILCKMDAAQPFCPAIRGIPNRVRPGAQHEEVVVHGANLPEKAQLRIFEVNDKGQEIPAVGITVVEGSYHREDPNKAVFRVNVSQESPAAAYGLEITSADGLFSVKKNNVLIVGASKMGVTPNELMADNRPHNLVIAGEGDISGVAKVLIRTPNGTELFSVDSKDSRFKFSKDKQMIRVTARVNPKQLRQLKLKPHSKGSGRIRYKVDIVLLDNEGKEMFAAAADQEKDEFFNPELYLLDIYDSFGEFIEKAGPKMPVELGYQSGKQPQATEQAETASGWTKTTALPITLQLNPEIVGKGENAIFKSDHFTLNGNAEGSIFIVNTGDFQQDLEERIFNGARLSLDGPFVADEFTGWFYAGATFAGKDSFYNFPYNEGVRGFGLDLKLAGRLRTCEIGTGKLSGQFDGSYRYFLMNYGKEDSASLTGHRHRGRFDLSAILEFPPELSLFFLPSLIKLKSGFVFGRGEVGQETAPGLNLFGTGTSLVVEFKRGWLNTAPLIFKFSEELTVEKGGIGGNYQVSIVQDLFEIVRRLDGIPGIYKSESQMFNAFF